MYNYNSLSRYRPLDFSTLAHLEVFKLFNFMTDLRIKLDVEDDHHE